MVLQFNIQSTSTWQSPDGMMETGLCTVGRHSIYYASLGNRPVSLADIKACILFMESLTQPYPLLLMSNCPGFELSPTAEAQGLVFFAGHYRALQQQHRQAGRLIISYAYRMAVGGTYLMHGLSASIKALAPDTVFHDTVSSRPPVPIAQVIARGLADEAVTIEDFPIWLEKHLQIFGG